MNCTYIDKALASASAAEMTTSKVSPTEKLWALARAALRAAVISTVWKTAPFFLRFTFVEPDTILVLTPTAVYA